MWLKQLFTETPIDFEKRCKNRIKLGIFVTVLGLIALFLVPIANQLPVLFMEYGHRTAVPEFYSGLGIGLLAAGIMTVIKNRRFLNNPALRKSREVYETDERNRMLGLRCWAYAGYSMFLALYIGVIVSGFISLTAMKVLLTVAGCFSLLLLVFRRLLQASM